MFIGGCLPAPRAPRAPETPHWGRTNTGGGDALVHRTCGDMMSIFIFQVKTVQNEKFMKKIHLNTTGKGGGGGGGGRGGGALSGTK